MGPLQERNPFATYQQENQRQVAASLAFNIQNRLGIKLAAIIQPSDLARIGLAVYGHEELDVAIPSIHKHVETAINNLPPAILSYLGASRDEAIAQYLELLGHIPGADQAYPARGEIANALRCAPQIVGQAQAEMFKKDLAQLMAMYFSFAPPTNETGVRIKNVDKDTALITMTGSPPIQIKPPTLVIEYGPGLVAFEKLTAEVAQTPRTILIERNNYVLEALLFGAQLAGLTVDVQPGSPAQVIGNANGMKKASQGLLMFGYQGMADVIINSRTHSAGEEELVTGIRNGYRLLRRGGLFVAQATYEVDEGEMEGRKILSVLQETFRKQPDRYGGNLTGRHGRARERRTGYNAVFVK